MSIKLLFADDSVTMQKVIQLTLENENVELLCASDGNKALTLAREQLPDVVVADVYMPGLDGFQLCKKLKETGETASIPVILISGELESYDPAEGVAAGAVGHITKPFKSGEFIELIKKQAGSAGTSAQKPGKGKGKAAPPPSVATEPEEVEEETLEPAVIQLTARAPGGLAEGQDSGEELEVVDEDIEDLAEDIDELDEEIEGEILEEEEAEAEALEAEEETAGPPAASRHGKVSLDDVLPSTDEVNKALANEAAEETDAMMGNEGGVYSGYEGDVVAEASGVELPPEQEEVSRDAERILDDVFNGNAMSVAPQAASQRGEDALEDAIASLDRAAMDGGSEDAPPVSAPTRDKAGQTPARADNGLVSEENIENANIWDAPKRELEEAVRREVETSAPRIIAAETSSLPPEQLEELFRESVGRSVEEFITSRAEEVFREEMRRAIETRFKESLDTQMEKVFREEIGRVIAASFQKAMPRMLAIIDKITVQITPRIAQHMIKIAIERIKKGEIN